MQRETSFPNFNYNISRNILRENPGRMKLIHEFVLDDYNSNQDSKL